MAWTVGGISGSPSWAPPSAQQHARGLDDEEGVAAARARRSPRGRSSSRRLAAGLPDELGCVGVRQRFEAHADLVDRPDSPGGPLVDQFGARRDDDQHAAGAAPSARDDALDQVQHLRPQRVRVLEHQRDRTLGSRAPRSARGIPRGRRARTRTRRGAGRTDPAARSSRPTVRLSEPVTQTRSINSRSRSDAHRSASSSSPTPAISRTIDASGRECGAVAVMWLRADQHGRPRGRDRRRTRAASRDLPMPGSPTIVNSNGRDVLTTRENERRRIASSSARPTNGIVRRADRVLSPSTGNAAKRLREPLRVDEPLVAERHHAVGQQPRRAPHDDLADGRRRPATERRCSPPIRSRGAGPPGRCPSLPRPTRPRRGSGAARATPTRRHRRLTRCLDSEPRAHRAQCVVLVHPRQPEHRHHGVPDELLGLVRGARRARRTATS